MTGIELRMSRFFERGENAVIVAVDHGGAYGPVPGLTDVSESLKQLEAADALLMQNAAAARWIRSRLLESGGPFIKKPLPRLIVRLNWSSNYVFQWEYSEGHNRQVISVKDAVSIGADAVLGSVFLHTGSEERDAASMATFGAFVEQKRKLGMPLMAEIYPARFMRDPSQVHEYISVTSRIVAELGADMIKTIYTGERFAEIVKSTPIPILVLGGEKTETEADALILAHRSVNAGARGIVFGRNVFMARRPEVFLEAVKRIVKKGEDPARVVKECGI